MALSTVAATTVAKPLVEKIVTELVAPKIIQFTDWCKGKYNEVMIPTVEHFQEYIERTYDKYYPLAELIQCIFNLTNGSVV